MSTPLRRDYPRQLVEWDARWNAYGHLEVGQVLDVSAAGAFVASLRGAGLPKGTRLQLSFIVPDGERRRVFNLACTVSWSGPSNKHRQPGFGVEFDGVQLALGALLSQEDTAKVLARLRGRGDVATGS